MNIQESKVIMDLSKPFSTPINPNKDIYLTAEAIESYYKSGVSLNNSLPIVIHYPKSKQLTVDAKITPLGFVSYMEVNADNELEVNIDWLHAETRIEFLEKYGIDDKTEHTGKRTPPLKWIPIIRGVLTEDNKITRIDLREGDSFLGFYVEVLDVYEDAPSISELV